MTVRVASREDLEAIVRLLFDDVLGEGRERLAIPLPPSYHAAFGAIETDPNNEVLVAELDGAVVGTFQLTYTPSLSYQGGWRATVESVRTRTDLRGRGIGALMMHHAVERARARGCRLVQLSTNRARSDAHRFYARLGFQPTHVGMKLDLAGGD